MVDAGTQVETVLGVVDGAQSVHPAEVDEGAGGEPFAELGCEVGSTAMVAGVGSFPGVGRDGLGRGARLQQPDPGE